MKPLKLKMCAFGPYTKPVEIDFEKGLAGNNFFLIHGATGSGKTTILDAICYAIYGKCSGGDRTGEMMRSEKAPSTLKTEVDFTFSFGGKIYRVVRTPKQMRPSKRGGGEVEEKAGVSIYVNGKLQGNERGEDYFKNLLHFDDKQFRQVVLLPQGEFRKFLMANSGERSELLNVIFNASLYKSVEEKLKENAAEAENELTFLHSRRENFFEQVMTVADLDEKPVDEDEVDEIIKNISTRCKSFTSEIDKLKIQADAAAKLLTDGKILFADFETLDKSTKKLHDMKISVDDAKKIFDAAQAEYDAVKADESRRRELERVINELQQIENVLSEFKAETKKLSAAEVEERDAQKNFDELKEKKVRYEARLQQLRDTIKRLDGADKKFKDAERKLDDAKKFLELSDELNRLQSELIAAKKHLDGATKNFDAEQLQRDRLIAIQKLCVAAKLAETLQDGMPCPVCGSTVHPKIAVSEEVIPTEEELEQAENSLKRRQIEKDRTNSAVSKISGQIDALDKQLERMRAGVLPIEEAQKNYDRYKKFSERLEQARNALNLGEGITQKLYAEIDDAQANLREKTNSAANLRGILAEKKNQIPQNYFDDEEKISHDLKINLAEKNKLDEAFRLADKNFQKAMGEYSRLEGALKAAEISQREAAQKVEGKTKPDVDSLQAQADAAQKNYVDTSLAAENLKATLDKLKQISFRLAGLSTEIQSAQETATMWQRLSDTANGRLSSRDGGRLSFQRYYLNSMFRHVILEANLRLEKMSGGRYQFRDKEMTNKNKLAGLDLEIFDANSGTCRDVATLSGGESFLASLALALGLAAVVKNTAGGIQLDTIFIDEGFGSLDSETLDYAINTLIDLQSDGRLVGIISHVEELRQRVQNRLEITKSKDGSSAKFIA
ncbi:MAG: SMC family ATPase [Selenomonadaceae bacterium]|nr:SMC family ATPase [Selenomonadaceae bacterium]